MGKYRAAAGGSSGGPAAVGPRAPAPAGPRSAPAADGDAPGQDEVLRRVSAAVLAVTRELSVGDVLQVIVRSVRSLAGARYAALGVPDDRGSFAEFVVDGISERWRKAIGRGGGARSRRRRCARAHGGRATGAPAGRGAVLAHDTTLPARGAARIGHRS